MNTVLAFGDNLTWGFDPVTEGRHPYEHRWTTVLQNGLGQGAQVIAEGLAGRTTAFDDPTGSADRNGARVLPTLLASHTPIDLVILMLGNSELRSFMGSDATGSMYGMQRLVEVIRTFPYQAPYGPPAILIVAPPPLAPTNHLELGVMFEGRIEESAKVASHYGRLARKLGISFFEAASVASVSPVDGAHLDVANNRALGEALVSIVGRILGR